MVLPGLVPASMAVWESQFDRVIGWIPKSFAICSSVTPDSRFWATLTTSSRNSFGYGFGIATSFQARSSSKPDEMSPIHAADPYSMIVRGDLASFLAFETIVRSTTIVYERVLIGGRFGDGVTYGTVLGRTE